MIIVPAAVLLAASLAARDHGGILAYRVSRTSEISAGPYHRKDAVELALVFDNDRLTNVRVLRDDVNGNAAGAAAQKSLADQLLAASGKPGLAVPFDAKHLPEYRYVVDGGHIQFFAHEKDSQHADGWFDVAPSGAVSAFGYVPPVLPRYATAGLVREQRAQVLPGFWATARSDESYDGRFMIFRGHAQFVTLNSDFHRFIKLADAQTWLRAEQP